MAKIKTLVVDDSGLMRLIIADIITADPTIEVIDTAEDGKEAFEKTLARKPDVVLLDLMMPNYNGLYAVEKIMAKCPTPIVIVSAINTSHSKAVITSLEMGAFDFVSKPTRRISREFRQISDTLIHKVKIAAKVETDVLRGMRISERTLDRVVKKQKTSINKAANKPPSSTESQTLSILAIGASTGGTAALEKLLLQLPPTFRLPILIGQHLPDEFTASFVERLNSLLPFKVQVAKSGAKPEKGNIYISPSSQNMVVKSNPNKLNSWRLELEERKSGQINHPCIDIIMKSVATHYKERALGIILTGMGEDGAKGLKSIKDEGGITYAQNKETCIVYGMPKAAAEIGAAQEILPLSDIPSYILNAVN